MDSQTTPPPANQSQPEQKTTTNHHSKLRVLLFDVEEDEEGEEEGNEVEEECEEAETHQNKKTFARQTEDTIDKRKDDRLFKIVPGTEVVPTTIASVPTAIVAPTNFSVAETKTQIIMDALTKEPSARRDQPGTPISAVKRRRQSPIVSYGQQEMSLRTPPVCWMTVK